MTSFATIAEAVKTALAGQDFSQEFTPRRTYLPQVAALEDLDTLHVFIVPVERRLERETRRDNREDIDVQVAILQRIVEGHDEAAHLARCDALAALAEEVIDFLSGQEMAGHQWQDTTHTLTHSIEQLDELGVFGSYITLTYRGTRALNT